MLPQLYNIGVRISKPLKHRICKFYSTSVYSDYGRNISTKTMEALTKLIDESTTPGSSTYVAPTIVGTVVAPGGISRIFFPMIFSK